MFKQGFKFLRAKIYDKTAC